MLPISALWELFKLNISSRCCVSFSARSFLYFSSKSFNSDYICSLLCFIKVLDCQSSSSSASFFFKMAIRSITSFAMGVHKSYVFELTPGSMNSCSARRSFMTRAKSFSRPTLASLSLLPCSRSACKDSEASEF